jgi:2'-5' RNA ligase
MSTRRFVTENDKTEAAVDNNNNKQMSIKHHSPATSHFDHVFSGFSIWLELETVPELQDTMKSLVKSCGGPGCGVYEFVPHVTIQYNIPSSLSWRRCKQAIQDDLEHFWNRFLKERQETNEHKINDNTLCRSTTPSLPSFQGCLTPYDWYYHYYPKHADEGKGFGASIVLLLIQNETWLQDLYQHCQDYWGKGERTVFIPHISLVYAPEDKGSYLKQYVEQQQQESRLLLHEPIRLRYLSVWNTNGRIQDWARIAKVSM